MKYPIFAEAIEGAKSVVDDDVEQKLFKRAIGYRYTETTRERINGKMTITKKVSKTHPPEVIAMIFWLKNRRPESWRDRKDVKVSGTILHFDSVVYEAVNGNGNGNGKSGGNGKSITAPASLDN